MSLQTKKHEHYMKEHDKKTSKLIMWSKINELISDGLNYSQISRQLEMHRQTVSHYASMTYEEFTQSRSFQREYSHKLDAYEPYVLQLLGKYPFMSAAQVHDRLRENYPDMKVVSDKTVFNFVKRIRKTHDIPKEEEGGCRPMCKLPESPFGMYAQVDFGEKWMPKAEGGRIKVYFMVMVLSRSRYKFVYFSTTPFTSAKAVYAHELAFQYFGGKPRKLVYDQDRVFIKDENLGDYLLTSRFKAFCTSEKIEVVFCRKSDPQSKGKVENAVKYVKNNFVSAREFTDIETLNREAMAWLGRTANGTMHHGIRQVPAEVFVTEREHLAPYAGTPTPPEEHMETRVVRQDNTVMYKGNFYTVPAGTYNDRDSAVYVDETDGVLNIHSPETGKIIASHAVSQRKGLTVSNANHMRQPSLTIEEYAAKVTGLLPEDERISGWMTRMREAKGRYYRDSLRVIERECWKYSAETIAEAFGRCLEREMFNAHTLFEVAHQIRLSKNEPQQSRPVSVDRLSDTFSKEELTPSKSSISTYNNLFEDAV